MWGHRADHLASVKGRGAIEWRKEVKILRVSSDGDESRASDGEEDTGIAVKQLRGDRRF